MPWRGNNESVVSMNTADLTPIFVNQSGDKLQGVLDMNFNKIINIPTPIERGDVANRDYVDITASSIKTFVKDKYPIVYGFRIQKRVTSTDYTTTVIVVVPNGTSPDNILFQLCHPLLRDIDYRVVTERGTRIPSKAQYILTFYVPVTPYTVIAEGMVYVSQANINTVSGKVINVSLESDRPAVSVIEAEE